MPRYRVFGPGGYAISVEAFDPDAALVYGRIRLSDLAKASDVPGAVEKLAATMLTVQEVP